MSSNTAAVGTGRATSPAASGTVDQRTSDDLISGLRDLAASVTAGGIGRNERLSRAGRAAATATEVRDLAAVMDPYVDGRHSRVADLLSLAGRPYGQDQTGATDRIAQAREHDRLTAQLRAMADVPGLHPTTVGPAATQHPQVAAWLAGYAIPATSTLGPQRMVPAAWDTIPQATINPSEDNPVEGAAPSTLDGEPKAWTISAFGVDESRQVIDWSADGGAELERLIAIVVDTGLEAELLDQLTTDAPAAADLDAAETAIGAVWPAPADLILCTAADRPQIVRHYGTLQLQPDERPTVLATAGATAGTAVMLATTAVHVEASAVEWQTATRPAELGADVVGLRYGRAWIRMAGAVQTVTLAA